MSTHNIQFHDKTISLYIFFLELLEEFRTDSKRVRISYGKLAISVQATEVRLYCSIHWFLKHLCL